MFPRVASLKIENPWQEKEARHPRHLRCTARLTRRLTSREAERLRLLLGVDARGDLLVYECRPEEVEDFEDRLLRALPRVIRRRAVRAFRRNRPSAHLAPVQRLPAGRLPSGLSSQ